MKAGSTPAQACTLKMTKSITTTISDEFEAIARFLGIKWAEAMRIGLAILFIERGQYEFSNPINAQRIKELARKLGVIN